MKEFKRFRQFRTTQEIRDQHAEVKDLTAEQFIYPYFVTEGEHIKREISTMEGVYNFSIDCLLDDIADARSLGINKVLLFGVIDAKLKDPRGSEAVNPDNIICRAIKAIKQRFSDILLFTDICMCEYTSHGHCGILCEHDVDNDKTLPMLAQQALNHALAGADWVAPSAMMDGQIAAIKDILEKHQLNTKVLGYSAKYSSSFYGPFRDAADSAPSFGNRKAYQMDYRTCQQGIDEIAADIEEGADWIMVKPAMAYLDMICRAHTTFNKIPLAAYQVSGEYSMLKLAAKAGFANEADIFNETLTAIHRAGAKYIITYYAKEYLRNKAVNH